MKHLKKLISKEEGFILVELIFVTAIIRILSQIGLLSGMSDRSNEYSSYVIYTK